LYYFEWIKLGLTEVRSVEGNFVYVTNGNPEPGSKESLDNYLDRCIEKYIEDNITYGNWTTRIWNIAGGPATLLWVTASCTETYITYRLSLGLEG